MTITTPVLASMTSHSPLLGCSHRCAQQVAENSWEKSKTSHQSYLMAWSGGLFLKWAVIRSPLRGRAQEQQEVWPTGGNANRIAPPPTADQSEAPLISTKPTERLLVPDGPPASCVGALMAPNSGLLLTRKGSISLRYITASLAPKRGAETRTTNHISERQGRV